VREEAGIAGLYALEASLALARRKQGGWNKDRVLVERTGGHDVSCDRVRRIMFEDDDGTIRAQQSVQLAEQVDMLLFINVVKDT
jgi:hypothetical protein